MPLEAAQDAPAPLGTHAPAPIGWYIHLPFCTTKCGYCDFYSLPTLPGLIDDLVEALAAELADRRPDRPVETLFIGGGTPTVLPAEALARVLDCLMWHRPMAGD